MKKKRIVFLVKKSLHIKSILKRIGIKMVDEILNLAFKVILKDTEVIQGQIGKT